MVRAKFMLWSVAIGVTASVIVELVEGLTGLDPSEWQSFLLKVVYVGCGLGAAASMEKMTSEDGPMKMLAVFMAATLWWLWLPIIGGAYIMELGEMDPARLAPRSDRT